jgi:hypothetical protein
VANVLHLSSLELRIDVEPKVILVCLLPRGRIGAFGGLALLLVMELYSSLMDGFLDDRNLATGKQPSKPLKSPERADEPSTNERESAWYAKPSKRPLAQLNSPLQKLLDDEKKDVATLNGLQQDLGAVRNVIQQEDVRVREQETAEARAQLELLHDKEKRIWSDAGKLLAELASTWNSYVELAEQEDKLANARGIGSDILAVEPAPLSFRSWLLLLHVAATDQEVRAEPHTEEIADSGIYGLRDKDGNDIGGAVYDTRVVGTRTLERRRRLDEHDVLYNAVPDLRSIIRRVQLGGDIQTIPE